MKAIIDDKIPFIKGKIERLVDEVKYLPGAKISAEDVRDADVLIVRTRTRCDETLLLGSKVRLVVTATIGYDHIDTAWCESAGIEWHNCPGCNASSVMVYVNNVLTYISSHFDRQIRTIGVVGVGNVGKLVVKNFKKLGYNVLTYDPYNHLDSFEEMKSKADVITFHVPLTFPSSSQSYPTHYMADKAFFDTLSNHPFIINPSRGGVVNEQDLLSAYSEHKVDGFVIDTWENEPEINRELLEKAIISTPHIAGYSSNGKMNATRMVLDMVAHHTGKPLLPREEFVLSEEINTLLSVETLVDDSEKLKANPEQFEAFRSNYPKRREPEL